MTALQKCLLDNKETNPDFNVADGCTGSPDFNFTECCNMHDLAYNKGGTENDRKAADKAMQRCIAAKKGHIIAKLYHVAVRLFGKSHFNYHILF